MKKKLKWRPIISFFCILALVFFTASLFSKTLGAVLVAAIVNMILAFAGLFPDHYAVVRGLWFDKILPATHAFFIILAIVVTGITLFLFFQKNKLSFEIEPRN